MVETQTEQRKWNEYLEDSFGYAYDDLSSICEYFGVSKVEAIGIMLIKELQKLNEHTGNIDFDMREGIRR